MVPSALRNPVAASIAQGVGDGMWGWGVLDLDAWGMSEEWYGMESELQGRSLILGHSFRKEARAGEPSARPTTGQSACICLPPTDSCLGPQWALGGPHEDPPAVSQLRSRVGIAPDLYSALPGKPPAGTGCYLWACLSSSTPGGQRSGYFFFSALEPGDSLTQSSSQGQEKE